MGMEVKLCAGEVVAARLLCTGAVANKMHVLGCLTSCFDAGEWENDTR